MKKIMFCLCGLPRCGKSTLAETILMRLNDVYIISTDKIRISENIKQDDISKTNDVYKLASNQLLIESGYRNTVFDACCNTIKKRNLIFRSTNKNSLKCLIELSIELDLIYSRVNRINKSNKTILGVNNYDVILKMRNDFEWPSASEKNNYDFYFKICMTSNNWFLVDKRNNIKNGYCEFNFIENLLLKGL